MKIKYKLLLIGTLMGLAFWGIDAAVDSLFFYPARSFRGLLIRAALLAAFALGGLVAGIYAGRQEQAAEQLRSSERAERGFREHLTTLHEVTNELSMAESFDELCRQAVVLGRSRLGFDRLGIWFVGDEPGTVVGSFGTDEHGGVRDERGECNPIRSDGVIDRILTKRIPFIVGSDYPIVGPNEKILGRGAFAADALWDGEEAVGYMTMDNLLSGEEISEQVFELFRVYASALGHLCTRKRVEEQLRCSEHAGRSFRGHLTALHEVTNKLSMAESFDELCRQAVVLGRSRLGFDRLGIWFTTDEPGIVTGSFGTDEEGNLRDERSRRHKVSPDSLLGQLISRRIPYATERNSPTHNADGEVVGTATVAADVLWNGEQVIGYISSDNLLRGEEVTQDRRELLHVYASALGHLCTQKRAEQSLRESEEQLRYLSAATVEGIVIHDNGVLLEANDQFCRMFGYEPDEIIGKQIIPMIVTPESAEIAREHMRNDSEEPYEVTAARKDGGTFPIEIHIKPMIYRGRKVRMGAVRDLSAREAVEMAVRRERDFADNVVETAQAAIQVLDENGLILRFNTFAQHLTGYEAREVLGKDWFELFLASNERDEARDDFRAILAGETRTGVLHHVLTKDGPRKLVRWYNSLLETPAGEVMGVLSIGHDITEIRQKDDQLLQAAKMEAIGRLAGGIAHDFNNMMAIIQGYADLMIQTMSKDNEYYEDVQRVRTASARAAGLTRQLLAFGRKQVTQPEALQLNSIVMEIDPMLRRIIGEDVELVMLPGADLWPIKAGEAQLEQLILNLAVNAREAMPGGGVLTMETTNTVVDDRHARRLADLKPGEYVVLAVSDTGLGMSEDVKAHIFEPFFTTKEIGRGTGLGLATCHGLVKQSGGDIDVISAPGEGTTFRLYFPRARDLADKGAPGLATAGELVHGKETVLVAEDEGPVRQLLVRVLGDAGYTVLAADDARSAIPLAEQHVGPIELLVTDVVMPGLSGDQLARRLRGARPEMKVLFVSGYSGDGVFRPEIGPDAAGFLAKPFSPSDLTEAVRRTLDAKKAKPAKGKPRPKRSTKKRSKS